MTRNFKSIYYNILTSKFVSKQRYEQIKKQGRTHIVRICAIHKTEISDKFFCPTCVEISKIITEIQAPIKAKEYYRRNKIYKDSKNLCLRCAKKRFRRALCKKHYEQVVEYERNRRIKRITSGKCGRCGNPIDRPGYHTCQVCINKINAFKVLR